MVDVSGTESKCSSFEAVSYNWCRSSWVYCTRSRRVANREAIFSNGMMYFLFKEGAFIDMTAMARLRNLWAEFLMIGRFVKARDRVLSLMT